MSGISGTVMVAEDEAEVRGYLETVLRCHGYEVETAEDGCEAIEHLRTAGPEIAAVLLDLVMPRKDGFQTLEEIKTSHPGMPVIVISGASSVPNVVEAMKRGAADFLVKPVNHEDVKRALQKALGSCAVRALAGGPGGFFAGGDEMRRVQSILSRLADSDVPVLLQGETGVGKEVLAREIHRLSPRAAGPFIKLNCAALPEELVESELFGHEQGSFTGAFRKQAGLFELADGGTLLLDEIGDMDLRLQAKLLQVLQDKEIRRIGGRDSIRVDVRILAATHQDLETAVSEGHFRADLYYRLNVIALRLPPLRERKDEIEPLAEFFLNKHGAGRPHLQITPALRDALLAHDWPGNIRELENVVRRFLVLRDAASIAEELQKKREPGRRAPGPARGTPRPEDRRNAPVMVPFEQAKSKAEAETIRAALDATNWHRREAAALLEMDYKALLYKMKKLSIGNRPGKSAAPADPAGGAPAAPCG